MGAKLTRPPGADTGRGSASSAGSRNSQHERASVATEHPLPPRPSAQSMPAPISTSAAFRVVCPSCNAILMPPAPLFRCPCGQLMTFSVPPQMATLLHSYDSEASGVPGGVLDQLSISGSAYIPPHRMGGAQRRQSHALLRRPNELEERLLALLEAVPRQSPQATFLRSLILRLPRGPTGDLDASALQRIAAQLEGDARSTPAELVELLPTWVWHAQPSRRKQAGGGGDVERPVATGAAVAEGKAAARRSNGTPAPLGAVISQATARAPPAPILADATESTGGSGTGGGTGAGTGTGGGGSSGGGSGSGTGSGTGGSSPSHGGSSPSHEQCSICLSSYDEGEQLLTLPCLHFFHSACARTWLGRSKLCPVCRVPVDVDPGAVYMGAT